MRTFLLGISQLIVCRLLCLLPSILERAQAKVEQQRGARPLAQHLAALHLQGRAGRARHVGTAGSAVMSSSGCIPLRMTEGGRQGDAMQASC